LASTFHLYVQSYIIFKLLFLANQVTIFTGNWSHCSPLCR